MDYKAVIRRIVTRTVPFVAALATVVGIVAVYRSVIPVNQTTVALTFLLAILGISTIWGFAAAAFMSIAAMLAFNYFFLPPVGTFTIADPQNWVALFAFLASSLIASQLSARARRQAEEARRRRDEVEHLYSFSRRLFDFRKCRCAAERRSQLHRRNIRCRGGGTLP